jgi:hypothetical protein
MARGRPVRAIRKNVAERPQQRAKLVVAAVYVADDVERAVFGAAIGPGRRAHDFNCIALFLRAQHVDVAEALLLQPGEPAAQILALAAHDAQRQVAVGAGGVPFEQQALGQIEDVRDG